MKPGKIVKRLRREAAANPKKAAILGILAVVSLYFWIPLVWGWVHKAEASSAATTDGASAAVEKPVAAAGTEKRHSWQQIVRWMQNDPRTMTAPPPAERRDPFEFPKTAVVKTKAEEEIKPPAPTITPSAAGLALTSTIVGPRSRLAQINGKTYSVGQNIESNNEKSAVQATFKLTEIHPRRVVLQSGSERFELTIPEPGKSAKIEIQSP